MSVKIVEPARETSAAASVDVLVVGGGPAGFIAATAAARLGVSVLLLERYGCLGGLATGGLVLYMAGLADGDNTRRVGGIPWESLERLRHMGGLASDGPLRLHVDSELYQVVADQLCIESQARLGLHALAVDALKDGNRVTGVIIETKRGRQAVLSRACIDATGDGDIAARAGAEFDTGRQRIGLNMKVGGVNEERYQQFQQEHPDRARALRAQVRAMDGYPISLGSTPHSDIGVYWVNVLGLASRDTAGTETGTIHEIFDGKLSAIDPDDLSYAQTTLRQKLVQSLAFYRDNVPGYGDARILSFAPQLGVRESRRIAGLYEIKRHDLETSRTFPDAIGSAGLGVLDNRPYQIPYRSLVPRGLDGLLVAGRCISADHWSQQAIRLIPAAMVSGQAAGTAAALCALGNTQPRSLETSDLRTQLSADGVIL